MTKRRWVTMQDVADRAGVGKVTVFRALRAPGAVSASTRVRIEAAMAELGYVPDDTAGALSTSRSRIVGVVVSTLADSVFASTVEGLSARLRSARHELLVTSADYAPEREEDAIRTLLGRRPDGLVLTGSRHTAAARRLLAAADLPVVEVWELPTTPIGHAVGFSNAAATSAMVGHLFDCGRRRFAFIGSGQPHDTRGTARWEGYRAALRDRKLGAPRYVVLADPAMPPPDRGAAGLAQALARWPDTDAVVCVSDLVAMGALHEARRRGIDVPGRMAVTGFGGFDIARESAMGLTTIEIAGRRIGEAAADILLAPPAGGGATIIDVGFHLARRGTG